jgi:hypothetical protein
MRVSVSLFVCSLGYELREAHLRRQQQRVPDKDCLDLLLLDLIIAVFGAVEGDFAVRPRSSPPRRRRAPAASATPQHAPL